MAEFRDWRRTLYRAQYAGVKFWVERDTIGAGRRLITHQFPHGETPYIEDLGRDAEDDAKIEVTAYFVGDRADSEAKALLAVCNRKGAKRLVLPDTRTRAHCEKARRDFQKDKLGYIAVSLSFVKDEAPQVPALPVAYLTQLVKWASSGVYGALQTAFRALFATAGLAGWVASAATSAIQTVAGTLSAITGTAKVFASLAANVQSQVSSLYYDAASLAYAGGRLARWESTAYVAGDATPAESQFVPRLQAVMTSIREAMAPADARRELAVLAALDLAPDTIPITASAKQSAANLAAIATMVRVAAVVEIATAAALQKYDDRRTAIQARADVADAIDAEVERLQATEWKPVAQALMDLGGRIAETISRKVTDLAPVIVAETNRSMPALWWSQRLYGSGARAGELVDRNRVIHPAFMPTALEALAR